MRDNAKGGALTEVTFFILLSLYTPKHGMLLCNLLKTIQKGGLRWGQVFIWCVELVAGKRLDCTFWR